VRLTLPWYDRAILALFPKWGGRRVQEKARAAIIARHYEAAQPGRRTQHWSRQRGDGNVVNAAALDALRVHARDLVRNNGWAKRARRLIANNTVGWGFTPKPDTDAEATRAAAMKLWKKWAGSTQIDAAGRLTFVAMQRMVMKTVPVDGEILFRRRRRQAKDPLEIPLQIQTLEGDHLDMGKDAETSAAGGPIVNGVEFDKLGRRAAYWLFREHPGSGRLTTNLVSERVPAADVIHVFDQDRAGEARGVSWFGAAIVNLKELDEFEDAELMKQKIAACFAAFVTDTDGIGSPLGDTSESDEVDTFEPGMIVNLPAGKSVTTASPPTVTNGDSPVRTLRRIAASLGVTYEEMTGDFSQVNFSSARMGRLVHRGYVQAWQDDMLVPHFCQRIWEWAMEAAVVAGKIPEAISAEWTAPPLPMIEPDKEGLAYQRLVRGGQMTLSQSIREQGYDPKAHLAEYAEDMAELDRLKLKLDSDARAVSQAGLTQERVGGGQGGKPPASGKSEEKESDS
jgi:lambda family phage portal protein